MKAGNIQDNPKRQGKCKSFIIDYILKAIETPKGCSIDVIRQSYKNDALFYSTCLIFATATNNALCAAIGIPVADGLKYSKALFANKRIWRIELVYCPFTRRKDWTLSTLPGRAFANNAGTSPTQSSR